MQRSFENQETSFSKGFSAVKHDILRSLMSDREALFSYEEIISWFTGLKALTDLDVTRCSIRALADWTVNEYSMTHKAAKYFEVIGLHAKIGKREVAEWWQPIMRQREPGIIGLILKKINGIYHLLVQAKIECGNFDVLEMAPTVQCITGSYMNPEYAVDYLEYFTNRKKIKILFDALQSEEGGRFFKEQNRNIVIEVDNDFSIEVKKRYVWMTFRQAKEFIKYNNYFNVEARSLIACISPI